MYMNDMYVNVWYGMYVWGTERFKKGRERRWDVIASEGPSPGVQGRTSLKRWVTNLQAYLCLASRADSFVGIRKFFVEVY